MALFALPGEVFSILLAAEAWIGTYSEIVCDILQTALQHFTCSHHELDIVDGGEPLSQLLEEELLTSW